MYPVVTYSENRILGIGLGSTIGALNDQPGMGAKSITKEQVAKLEAAHKNLFVQLVLAAILRRNLLLKFGKDSKQFKQFNRLFWIRVTKFVTKQRRYESKGIPRIMETGDLLDAFNTREGLDKLMLVAKEYDKEGKGIGFIPLLIWGVIALVGMFTADSIVDETTNTAEEIQKMTDSTNQFCKDNNMTPDDCRKIMQEQIETTKSEGGFFSGIMKWILIAAAAFFGFKYLVPMLTKPKT